MIDKRLMERISPTGSCHFLQETGEVQMTPQERAIRVVQTYWEAAGNRDYQAGKQVMAENVFRVGPFNSPVDQVKGREAYTAYIRTVQEKMTSYRNETHDILASRDGSRVYLQCTEWPALEGNEFEFPLCIIFDINEEFLISRIDIYWKTPPDSTCDWVRAEFNL